MLIKCHLEYIRSLHNSIGTVKGKLHAILHQAVEWALIIIHISLFRTNLAVHVVLGLNQLASVHLPCVGLTGHDVSLCFMQDLDWHTNGHLSTVFLKHNTKA